MWQLKEVDRIAVVNLTKSGFRIYLQNLTAQLWVLLLKQRNKCTSKGWWYSSIFCLALVVIWETFYFNEMYLNLSLPFLFFCCLVSLCLHSSHWVSACLNGCGHGLHCIWAEFDASKLWQPKLNKSSSVSHVTVLIRVLQKCLMHLGGLTVTYPYLVKQAT